MTTKPFGFLCSFQKKLLTGSFFLLSFFLLSFFSGVRGGAGAARAAQRGALGSLLLGRPHQLLLRGLRAQLGHRHAQLLLDRDVPEYLHGGPRFRAVRDAERT